MEKDKENALSAKDKNKYKKILLILVGLQFLILAVTMYVFLSGKSSSPVSAGSSGNDSFPFIPIGAAIFIPLIVAMKKRPIDKLKSKKWYYTLLIGLAIFVLIVMLVFLSRAF